MLFRILITNQNFGKEQNKSKIYPKMSKVIADEIGSKVIILSPLEFGDDERTWKEWSKILII